MRALLIHIEYPMLFEVKNAMFYIFRRFWHPLQCDEQLASIQKFVCKWNSEFRINDIKFGPIGSMGTYRINCDAGFLCLYMHKSTI